MKFSYGKAVAASSNNTLRNKCGKVCFRETTTFLKSDSTVSVFYSKFSGQQFVRAPESNSLHEKGPYSEFFWSVDTPSECEIIRIRKTLNTHIFHAMTIFVYSTTSEGKITLSD